MISGNLKAQDSIPRASLPFSWNADGDSGSQSAGPTGGAAFLQHLDTAQSVHSQATGGAPKSKDPTSHDRELPSDAPSNEISLPPSVQQSARPLVKPSRKVAAPPRAMIHAKARFVGPSAGSAPASHGLGVTPSAIAARLSCDNPPAHSPRLNAELPNRPLSTSAVDTRTEWPHGFPQRPLMDSLRSTESKIVWSHEQSSEHHPSSGSLRPANDTLNRPSPGVASPVLKESGSRPAWASPSNPLSGGHPPVASVLDEVAPKLSMEAHRGASASETLANPSIDGTTIVAALNPANRASRVAGAIESLQSNTSSRSSISLVPSDLKQPISSEVRDAARRAVAQSQILEFPSISEPPVRHTNNDALRSLVLDLSTSAGSNSISEFGPALAERLGKTDGRPSSEPQVALGQVSVSPRPVTASLTSETVVQAASEFSRRAHVPGGNPDPGLDPFRGKISTTHPTPLHASESPATWVSDLPSELVPSDVPEDFADSGKSSVSVATPESGFQSVKHIESRLQDGEFIPREKNSIPPGSESLASTSTTDDIELSSTIDSSLTVAQSQPLPSGPSSRSAMRSPLARNPNAGEFNDTAEVSLDSEKSFPTLLDLKQGTEASKTSESLARDGGSDSPSPRDPDSSPGVVVPTAVPFPGGPQSGPIQERLDGRIANQSKPEESNLSPSVLQETQKPGAVRLVQLDSPGSGSLELRIQEVGEKLIIRTQDLVGSLEGQSAQWKELQQRLESNGIVLMPIEHSISGIATPIESQNVSTDSRHTVCYDGGMGSSGRDGSDPRSSSGRARALHQSAHPDSSESSDESIKSGEALPASRQWWA